MTLLKSPPTKRKPRAAKPATVPPRPRGKVDETVERGEGKPHPGRRMTEAEFVNWVDDWTRAEWVDGEVIVMPPVSLDHGKTVLWVIGLAEDFIEHNDLGTVHGPEILIRLPRLRRRRLPDVAVVLKARAAILRPTVIDGPPDLIVEVVSPDSVARDWQKKYLEYAKAGVKEYWVIDRLAGQMEAYTLRPGGKYQQIPEADGKVASVVLKGFYLRPAWVLGTWQTSRRAAAKELGVGA